MVYMWFIVIPFVFYCISDTMNFTSIDTNYVEYKNFFYRKSNPSNWILFGMVVGLTTFLFGIRYFVGTDYQTYSQVVFPEIVSNTGHFEIIFSLIVKGIMPYFGTNGVFIVIALVTFVFLYLGIKQQSPYFTLSVIFAIGCLFFSFSMSGIRQGVSMAIFVYSLKYIVEGNWKKYFVFILIAIGFHTSALLYLPLFFVRKFSFGIKRYFILPILIVLTPLLRIILVFISNKTGIYSSYFASTSYWGSNIVFNVLVYLINLILVFMYFKHFKQLKKDDPVTVGLNIQYLAVVLVSISTIIPSSTRVILLIMLPIITLIPLMLAHINNLAYRLGYLCFFLSAFAIIFYWYVIVNNYYATFPYQILWKNIVYVPSILQF